MVAIFTGGGLGLDRSSATFLGANGLLGQSAQGRGLDNVYVNAANGNLVVSSNDEMLFGTGTDAIFSNTYNSQGLLTDDNADNWRSSASRSVGVPTGNTAGSTVTRTDWDGSQVVFTWVSNNTYQAKETAGAYDTLTLSGSTWTWTNGDNGGTETYDSVSGQIQAAVDRNGKGLSFTYSSGLLSRVTALTPGGQVNEYVNFVYSGSNLIELDTFSYANTGAASASGSQPPQSTRVHYTYDGLNRLTKVVVDLSPNDNSTSDGYRYETTYGYDGTSKRVASILQSDGSQLTIAYDVSNRVQTLTQAVASGVSRITSFDYSHAGQTWVTDPAGQVTKLSYDTTASNPAKFGQLTQIDQTPVGGTLLTTKFNYDDNGNVTSKTAPGGQVTTYQYDAYGNCILEQDALGDTVTRTYGQPNALAYSQAFQTSAWQAILGATATDNQVVAPDGSTTAATLTFGTSNGSRLEQDTLIPAVAGQAWTGSVWLKGSGTINLNVGPTIGGNGESEVTIHLTNTWTRYTVTGTFTATGGAVRLMIISRTGSTATTCSAWGAQLESGSSLGAYVPTTAAPAVLLFSETKYTVPDPDGAGSGQPSGAGTSYYTYDSHNNLRYAISAPGDVTQYSYDTSGRLTSTIQTTAPEARTNLALRSQELDNSSVWVSGANGTGSVPVITANAAIAPDGTTTADRVTFNTGSGSTATDQSFIYQNFSVPSGALYTGSFWVQGPAGQTLIFRHAGCNAYTAVTLTGAWQRVSSVEAGGITGTVSFYIGLRQAVGFTLPSNVTVNLWGVQFEAGAFASSYIPTTTAAVTRNVLSVSVPETRTNLFLQSQFASGWPAPQSTLTPASTMAPDGTTTGAVLTENTVNTQHWAQQTISKAASPMTYTGSVFVKPKGSGAARNLKFTFNDGAGSGFDWIVDPSTGVTVSGPTSFGATPFTSISTTITACANGWYRAAVTFTSNTSTSLSSLVQTASGTSYVYAGDGASGLQIWGAQLEQGASASSYIPTTTSAVTRNILSASGSPSSTQLDTWFAGLDISAAQRTDTAYDFRGNVANVKSYAQLNRDGTPITTSGVSKTTYIYDQGGRLLSKLVADQTGAGSLQSYAYDGLGRLIAATEPSAVTAGSPSTTSGGQNLLKWSADATQTSAWSTVRSTASTDNSTITPNGGPATKIAGTGASYAYPQQTVAVVGGSGAYTVFVDLKKGSGSNAIIQVSDGTSTWGLNCDLTAITASTAFYNASSVTKGVIGLSSGWNRYWMTIPAIGANATNLTFRVYLADATMNPGDGGVTFATTDYFEMGQAQLGPNLSGADKLLSTTVFNDASDQTIVTNADGSVQTTTYDFVGEMTTSVRGVSILPGDYLAGSQVVGTGDLNGDGVADIVLRNNTTGQWGYLAGTASGVYTWVNVGASNSAYAIVGVADLSGDGRADVVFRNTSTGDWAYTTFDATGGSTWHAVGAMSLGYAVAGFGDINGDGRADVVFRNPSTGDWGYTSFDSTGASTWHSLGVWSAAYAVVGVGDINGDGRAEVVFRFASTGDLGYVAFDSAGASSWRPACGSSLSYSAVGVGDVNGDGRAEVIFRNSTGDLGYMGLDPAGNGYWQSMGGSSSARTVIGVGDTNGDRIADLIYQDSATGRIGWPLPTTSFKYDAQSNLRIAIDPLGAKTFYLYDAIGRKVAQVLPDGSLTEYGYDANGELTVTIDYATNIASLLVPGPANALVDSSGNPTSVTLTQIRPGSSAADVRNWRIYDDAGRLAATVDGAGDLVRYVYDGAGQLTRTITGEKVDPFSLLQPAYVATTTSAVVGNLLLQSQSFTSAPWLATAAATVTASAVAAPDGTSTAALVDVSANVGGYSCFSQPVASQSGATYTWSVWLKATGTNVGKTIHLDYSNASGNRQITLTGGWVRYSVTGVAAGNIAVRIISYPGDTATQVLGWGAQLVLTSTIDPATATLPLNRLPPVASTASTTRYFYDADGRQVGQLDPDGYLTQTVYDAAGRKAQTIQYAGATAAQNRADGTLSTLLNGLANNSADIHNWWIYDDRGLVAATIDGAGQLTRYAYDGAGRVVGQTTGEQVNPAALVQPAYVATFATAAGPGNLTVWSQSLDAPPWWGLTRSAVDANATSAPDGTLTADRLRATVDGGPYAYQAVNVTAGQAYTQVVYLKADTAGWAMIQLYSDSGPHAGRFVNLQTGALGSTLDYGGWTTTAATVTKAANGFWRVSLTTTPTTSVVKTGVQIARADGQVGNAGDSIFVWGEQLVQTSTIDLSAASISLGSLPAVGGSATTSTFQYDAAGDLQVSADPVGRKTYSLHDARGRLVETIDPAGRVTQYTYDAASRVVSKITYANTLSQATLAGFVSAPPTTASARPATSVADQTTGYTYDADGNLTAVTDLGTNGITRYLYDADGRQMYAIDAAGDVAYTAYDGAGRVKQVIRYANPISLSGLSLSASATDITGRLTTSTANDQTTTTVYDQAGRVAFTIDPMGKVCAYTYDAAGNLINETHYGATYTVSGYPLLPDMTGWAGSHVDAANDRVTRYVYDADNREVFSVDAANAVTAHAYDAFGNVVQETRYADAYGVTGNPSLSDMTGWTATSRPNAADDRVTQWAYDADGRLAFMKDGEKGVIGYAYDAFGKLAKTTRYSAAYSGSLSLQDWANGNSHPLADQITRSYYDAAGRLTYSVVDGYVDAGQIYAYVTGYAYDPAGLPLGTVREIRYATPYPLSGEPAQSAILSWVQANPSAADETTTTTYDGLGRVKSATNSLGQITTYAYAYVYDQATQAVCLQTDVTDYRQHTTRTLTDRAGRLAATIVDPGALNLKTTYQYDAFGNVKQKTDPNNNDPNYLANHPNPKSTTYYYDKDNRLIVEVSPLGDMITKTEYDARGQVGRVSRIYSDAQTNYTALLASLLSPNWGPATPDEVTTYVHDLMGRLKSVTDAETGCEHYELNAFGERKTVFNKLNGQTDNTFDHLGRLTQEVQHVAWQDGSHAQTITNQYHYDVLGNHDSTVLASGVAEQEITNFKYDLEGRQIEQRLQNAYLYTDSGNAVHGQDAIQSTQYDAFGNVVLSTDANGGKTYAYYDAANRKVAQVDPAGSLTIWNYDPVLADPVTHATTQLFGVIDEIHFRDAVTAPATGGPLPSTFLQKMQDAEADQLIKDPAHPENSEPSAQAGVYRLTRYVYDKADRLLSTAQCGVLTGHLTDVSHPKYWLNYTDITTQNTYDANGNVTRVTDPRGYSTYFYYDADGRKTVQVDAMGYFTAYGYDAFGNVSQETQFATRGVLVTSTPTAAGEYNAATAIAPGSATGSDRVTDFLYDRNNRVTSQTRENVQAWTVSGAGVNAANGSSQIQYRYDGLGNLTYKIQATGDCTKNVYDSFGRLISALSGRMVSNSFTTAYVDDRNTAVSPETDYAYDALGRVTTATARGFSGDADRVTTTAYGIGGRVKSLSKPGAKNADGTVAPFVTRYVYDLAGQKVLEQYDRQKSDGSTPEHDAIVYTYDADGRETSQIKGLWSGTWPALGGFTFTFDSSASTNGVVVKDSGVAPILTQGVSTDQYYDGYGEIVFEGTDTLGDYHKAQKFAEYDGVGRVWRSNMTDGATRAYAYDESGNATLLLQTVTTDASGNAIAGFDIGNKTAYPSLWALIAASVDPHQTTWSQITETITLYDQRNEVVQTYQPTPNQTANPVQFQKVDTTGQSITYFFGTISPNTSAGYVTQSPYTTATGAGAWAGYVNRGGGVGIQSVITGWQTAYILDPTYGYPIGVVYDATWALNIYPSAGGAGGLLHILNGAGAEIGAFWPGQGAFTLQAGESGWVDDPGVASGAAPAGWYTILQDVPWGGQQNLGSVYVDINNYGNVGIPRQLILQGIADDAAAVRVFVRDAGSGSDWVEVDASYDTIHYWHFNIDGWPFSGQGNHSWEVRYMAFNGSGYTVDSKDGLLHTDGNGIPYYYESPPDNIGGTGQQMIVDSGGRRYLIVSGMPAGTAFGMIWIVGGTTDQRGGAYSQNFQALNNGGWGQPGLYYFDITDYGAAGEYWIQPMSGAWAPLGPHLYGTFQTGQAQMTPGVIANRSITLSAPNPAVTPTTNQRARYFVNGAWSGWQPFATGGNVTLDLSGATDFWHNSVQIEYEAFNNNLSLQPPVAGVGFQRVRLKGVSGTWGGWISVTGSGVLTTDISGALGGGYNDNDPVASGYLYQYETYTADPASGGQLLSATTSALTGRTSHFSQTVNVDYSTQSLATGQSLIGPQGIPANIQFDTQRTDAALIKVYYRAWGSSGAFVSAGSVTVDTTTGFANWNVDAAGLRPPSGQNKIEYYYDVYDGAGHLLPSLSGEDHVHGSLTISSDSYTTSNDYSIQWMLDLAHQAAGVGTTAFISRSQDWNAFGEIKSETDGRGNETDFTYNTLGKLTDKIDPLVAAYNNSGQEVALANNRHLHARYFYDISGRQVALQDEGGYLQDLIDGHTAPVDGLTTHWLLAGTGYDGQAAETTKEFEPDPNNTKTFAYDAFGEVKKITDATGAFTLNSYDGAGNLIEVDHPTHGGLYSSAYQLKDYYSYDNLGQRLTHRNSYYTDANATERTDYDAQGRITQTFDFDGHRTKYDYTWMATLAAQVQTAPNVFVNLTAGGAWETKTTNTANKVSTEDDDLFGHVVQRTDFAGRVYNYTYNLAGKLAHQSNSNHLFGSNAVDQSIDYVYYTDGYIKSVTDNALHMRATYAYDNDGNRTFEAYASTDAAPRQFENATTTYDAMNRITEIKDTAGRTDITYKYDGAGNRREVDSKYVDTISGLNVEQDYWYDYDSMNRFVVTMGQRDASHGNLVFAGTTGVALTYDSQGNRATAFYGKDGHTETYSYTADGYLERTTISGVGETQRTNDALGRVTDYKQLDTSNTVISRRTNIQYNGENQVLSETDNSSSVTTNVVNDYLWNGSSYAAGDYQGVITHSASTRTDTGAVTDTKYFYSWWDQAKQSDITVNLNDPTDANFAWSQGGSRLTYDANGHIATMAKDVNGAVSFTWYDDDANGQVLFREERVGVSTSQTTPDRTQGTIGPLHWFYYFNGKTVGDIGNDGVTQAQMDYAQELAFTQSSAAGKGAFRNGKPVSSADFDQSYQPINSGYPGFAAQTYTVRAGDTLTSIALTVWGDANLWYLIADANGVSLSTVLQTGRVLTIPNKVANFHNNASTFRPYNPGVAIGDTLPTVAPVALTPEAAAFLRGEDPGLAAMAAAYQEYNEMMAGLAGMQGNWQYLQAWTPPPDPTVQYSALLGGGYSGSPDWYNSDYIPTPADYSQGYAAWANPGGYSDGYSGGGDAGGSGGGLFGVIGNVLGGLFSGIGSLIGGLAGGFLRGADWAGGKVVQGLGDLTGAIGSFAGWGDPSGGGGGGGYGIKANFIAEQQALQPPDARGARFAGDGAALASDAPAAGGPVNSDWAIWQYGARIVDGQVAQRDGGGAVDQLVVTGQSSLHPTIVAPLALNTNIPNFSYRSAGHGSLFGNIWSSVVGGWNAIRNYAPTVGHALYGAFVQPELDVYRDFVDRPYRQLTNAIAETPLGDPGTYATLQSMPLPVARAVGGFGAEIAYALNWMRGINLARAEAVASGAGRAANGFELTPTYTAPLSIRAGAAADNGASLVTTQIRNGYTYTIDGLGRTTSIEGDLVSNAAQGRNGLGQLKAGGADRLATDEGGHFIGRRFDGPLDDSNHFAQDMNFNRGAYKSLENSWQRALDNGSSVNVNINPSYSGSSLRPSSLDLTYTIDGVPYRKTFLNRPGG